jgi:hypothetical protein
MSLRKNENLKKPEIIQDYNKFTQGIDRTNHILHYYPCCRKTLKRILCSFLLHMAALNSFVLFKKYTTNQNQKGKGYAFKDFILDCVQETTEPEESR